MNWTDIKLFFLYRKRDRLTRQHKYRGYFEVVKAIAKIEAKKEVENKLKK
jgi:hypothetical protein